MLSKLLFDVQKMTGTKSQKRDARMRGSGPAAKNLKGTQFHLRKIDFMKVLSELM